MKLKSTMLFLFLTLSFFKIISQPINLDFSAGNINGWDFENAISNNSSLMTTGAYSASTQYSVMLPGNQEVNGVPLTMNSPLGGNFMRIGNSRTGSGSMAYRLKQKYRVTPSSNSLIVNYAIIFEDGPHECSEQPYFYFVVKDSLGNVIENSNSYLNANGVTCSSGDPSFITNGSYKYKNWSTQFVSLQNYVTTMVSIEFIVAGCVVSQGAHTGYAYVDADLCNNSTAPTNILVNGTQYPITQSTSTINLCGNTSAAIVAPTGATSFSWTGGAINGLTTQSVSITQPGQYSLLCNKPFECSNTTKVSFIIGAYPSLSVSASTIITCPGAQKTLTASGALSYTWSSVSGTSSTNSYSSIQNINPFVTSVYNLKGQTAIGCVSSINYTVPVSATPSLSVVGSTLICSSNPVNLIVSGADTYVWGSGATTNSIWVTPTVTTTYSVTGTSSITGCSAVYYHTVNVDSYVTLNSSNYQLCIGDGINVFASGATSYTWSNGATTNPVTLKPTTTTSYFVNGITACGLRQAVFTVTVNPLPTFSIIANPPNVCGGNSAVLSGIGTPSLSYYWLPAVPINGAVTPTIATTYTATGIDINGCINTKTVLVSVLPGAPVSIISPTAICAGQSATLTANGINSYTWNTGSNAQSIVVSPTVNTVYSVYGNDITGACGSVSQNIQVSTGTPSMNITVTNYTACPGNNVSVNVNSLANYLFSTSPPLNVNQSGSNLVLSPTPVSTTIYTINAANGCGVASSTININALSSPTVTLTGPDTVCASTTYTFYSSGVPSSNWAYSYGSSYINVFNSNSFTISPTSTFSLILNGYDSNFSCPSEIQKTITVINDLKITTTNTAICFGTSAILIGSGSSSYLWSNGVTTNSIIVTPSVSTSYSVIGTSSVSCTNTKTITVTVNSNCQDVWPGDANSDGVADNLDILELGLHYLQTGAPRASISNAWQSYFSNNWSGTITNGKNLNHSDCNGDGTINDNDTLAIFNNYGLTHAFRVGNENMISPQLTIVPDQPILPKGAWGTSSIYLGDASNIINDINGVAFTVNFDNTIIEPNTVWLEYPASFINSSNQNLHFRKSDFANGKIYTATTHTINNNVSGNGLIGILHYQIKSSLTTDTVLNLGISQAVHSDVAGTIYPLTAGKSVVTILVNNVGLQETINSNFISMIPNPTDGILTINSKTELQKIEVLSITGQVLQSEVPSNVSHTLHLENFANGIYFVNLYQNNRIVKREKVIVNN